MYFVLRGIIQNKVGLHPNDGVGKGDKFLNAMTSHTASFIYVLLAAFAVRFITVLASAEGNDIITNWATLAQDIANKGFISYYNNSANNPQGVIGCLEYSDISQKVWVWATLDMRYCSECRWLSRI